MLKILGFDSWTGGWFNFARLVPAFDESDMELVVVHIGSWGSDPGRPSRETIAGVEFRDVTSYGGRSFDEILDIEQPHAVLLLSTQTFAHRAFLRYCNQRSIPSLHLYHGIANVQVTDDELGSHRIGRLAYARYALPKVGKLLRRTFPCYIAALRKTNAKHHEWIRFLADVSRMARGAPSLVAANDAGTTKGAVYTTADVEQAVRVYGFAPSDVIPVGNPDLVRFGFDDRMLGLHNHRSTSSLPYVMYVDTALSVVGLLFKSHKAFIAHLVETANSVAAHGKTLAWKPHPAHDVAALQRDLAGSNIELVSNEDFVPRLVNCCACIAETTSIALLPALTGMPVLFAQYGDLSDQRFGRALTSYPRGHTLGEIRALGDILRKDADDLDTRAVAEWIASNSGPMPADHMPQRVVQILRSMIVGSAAARADAC